MHRSSTAPADSSLSPTNGSYSSGAPPPPPPPPLHQNFYPGVNPDISSSFRAMYPMSKDFLGGKSSSRRMKRMVPNEHKDDRYWEKRMRNNDAARRSRENKRHVEMGMRARTIFLEEEITLLRKEVSVLKTKFSLSPDCRYLGIGSNGELVSTSASAAFKSIEEVITSDIQAKFMDEYPPSESPSSGLAQSISSSADMEGSSSNGYVPMKKRRRLKLEAERSYLTGSSASGMSPSESVGTPHYPSAGAEPAEERVYHSSERISRTPEMDHIKTQSNSTTPNFTSACPTTSSLSSSSSLPNREHYSYAMPRGSHHNEMNYSSGVYSSPSLGLYPPSLKLPGLNYIRMLPTRTEDRIDHPASLPSLSPRSRIPSEVEDSTVHRENDEIRIQLLQLSAEVARMKNCMRPSSKAEESC